jgi:hypothetical protein
MLVRAKGNRASMTLQIATQSVELSLCAFAANKAQLHQFARSTIDEYQQGAGLGTIFESAMLAAIDLDQFAINAHAAAAVDGNSAVACESATCLQRSSNGATSHAQHRYHVAP